MPDASTTGASTNGDSARRREHNQGNQARKYTPEQEATVQRIRRCNPTAFYEILDIPKTASDAEVKKAYRKLSLLTHPDKNGHPHADEAFKMVARAFSVLGDKEKREKFDKWGTDPDSRFAQAQAQAQAAGAGMGGAGGNPFMGRRGQPMWDEEISPEELFARMFGGPFGGFGGPFGGELPTYTYLPTCLPTHLKDCIKGTLLTFQPSTVNNLFSTSAAALASGFTTSADRAHEPAHAMRKIIAITTTKSPGGRSSLAGCPSSSSSSGLSSQRSSRASHRPSLPQPPPWRLTRRTPRCTPSNVPCLTSASSTTSTRRTCTRTVHISWLV